jgi:hypothetical protein
LCTPARFGRYLISYEPSPLSSTWASPKVTRSPPRALRLPDESYETSVKASVSPATHVHAPSRWISERVVSAGPSVMTKSNSPAAARARSGAAPRRKKPARCWDRGRNRRSDATRGRCRRGTCRRTCPGRRTSTTRGTRAPATRPPAGARAGVTSAHRTRTLPAIASPHPFRTAGGGRRRLHEDSDGRRDHLADLGDVGHDAFGFDPPAQF